MNVSDLWTPRQICRVNASTTVPRQLSLITDDAGVDTISYSGTTVTVSLLDAHQLRTGDMVEFAGAWSNSDLIGKFKITVVTTQSFSVVVNKAPTAAISAGAGSYLHLLYSFASATVLGLKAARTANSSAAFIGVTSTNGDQPYQINPYNNTTQDGIVLLGGGNPEHRWKLSDWYLDVGSAGDGVMMTLK